MFDFLFKRKTRKPSPAAPTQPSAPVAVPGEAKRTAMMDAQAVPDEAAAVVFILQCEFADARLTAAEQVQTRPALEQVLKAMRNTDRRVAKLIQGRLDVIAHRHTSEQHAQRCIDDATRLLQQDQLMPNQVADLDRAWLAAGDMSPALREGFDPLRATLRDRLEAQATLQRAVIDTLSKLKDLIARADDLDPTDVALALAKLEAQMAGYLAAAAAIALPSQLAAEFNERKTIFRQTLALLTLRHQGVQIRVQKLDAWDKLSPEELHSAALQREWQALPALQANALSMQLQAQFETILTRIIVIDPPQQVLVPVRVKVTGAGPGAEFVTSAASAFPAALEAMEKALEDGFIRLASEHDKTIRSLDIKAVHLSDAHSAQLARARSELGRLQAWAKWGGTVSREELLKAAEVMAGQSIAPAELAKKIGSLRERWKSLETSAGSASRELWERFDAACTLAYAPAAEHFKQLSAERQQNQIKAQALIAEAAAFSVLAQEGAAEPDSMAWRDVAQFCMRTTQAWQRLGTIDRKEKKRLDSEFDATMQLLSAPLSHQRQLEIARREALIAEADALRPTDRAAPDLLRALQERWQEQSKSVPLERRDEQALWQRFRSACDAVFAKRKEAAVSADADRRVHLDGKEALCATLEAAVQSDDDVIATLIRATRDAWAKIGPVPHAAESQLETRYRLAVAALQTRLDDAKHASAVQEVAIVLRKLGLCRAAEDALLAGVAWDAGLTDQWHRDWQAMPVSASPFERVIRNRLDAAVAAWQSAQADYAALLESNRPALLHEILRFEILSGMESPIALSRARLQLQVEVLQSSLKAGAKPVPQQAQLLALCGLAAATDAETAARFDLVMGSLSGIISR